MPLFPAPSESSSAFIMRFYDLTANPSFPVIYWERVHQVFHYNIGLLPGKSIGSLGKPNLYISEKS